MQIKSKKDAKTAVSALRRELKILNKAPDSLSHSDCLTVMAKALGFSSWNEWEATLADDLPAVPVAPAAQPERPRYPLKNIGGQYDFLPKGEQGTPFDSDFQGLLGQSDYIRGTALINNVFRNDGVLDVEYEGSTKVDWDSQKTLKKDGEKLWVNESGIDVPESQIILLPESFQESGYANIYDDEYDELPVREALVLEFVEWLSASPAREKLSACQTEKAVLKLVDEAERKLGFSLIYKEITEVLRRVDAAKAELV